MKHLCSGSVHAVGGLSGFQPCEPDWTNVEPFTCRFKAFNRVNGLKMKAFSLSVMWDQIYSSARYH